jgi:transcriptional regulator GlxA family with amidase domain
MKIDIVVYDGLDELDAVGPLEVLRGMEGTFDVRLVTRTAQPEVAGQHRMRLAVDAAYEPGRAELLIVPGGGWVKRTPAGAWGEIQRGDWLPLLAEAAHGAMMASVCTGAMLLAHAGITRGRRATTHHSAWADLAQTGALLVKERVVDDGNLITAGGVTSGIDLALWLIERFVSRDEADRAAERLEYVRYRPY